MLTPVSPDFRRVSTTSVHPPREVELPLIDLTGIDGDLDARTYIAAHVRKAAENTVFSTFKAMALITVKS